MTEPAATTENTSLTFGIGPVWRQLTVISCYLGSIYIAYTFLKYMHVKFLPDPYMGKIFQDLETWVGFDWVNPYFRFFTGGVEAVASLLLFIPGFQLAGAFVTLGTLVVALLLHVPGPIGIEGARGALALEAVICVLLASWIVYVRRGEVMELVRFTFTDRTWTRK
jgi:uncharacterized membrane protein YphA (DoxX/SURF4 family)